MTTTTLERPQMATPAAEHMQRWKKAIVDEVRKTVAENPVVVIGMGWNPHVRRARRALDAAGVRYAYLGYGNYLTQWRERLAIKIWSGWPTFPQVYVDGQLLGGADQTEAALARGELKAR